MKAMILAAGFGTRLRPLTNEIAKPAIPLLGEPLVVRLMHTLSSFGVTQFKLNVHHLPETIQTAIQNYNLGHVSFSFEKEILGTAGGLKKNEAFFGSDTFLMANADILLSFDLAPALEFHKRAGALSTLLVIEQASPFRYSPIKIDDQGKLLNLKGTWPGGQPLSETFVFTGIHILEQRIFDYIPSNQFYEINDHTYPEALKAGENIRAFPVKGYWNDLGTPDRYLEAQRFLMKRQHIETHVETGSVVHQKAHLKSNTYIGNGSIVRSGASVSDSIIWNDVTIHENAQIQGCIIANGTHVLGEHINEMITRTEQVKFR